MTTIQRFKDNSPPSVDEAKDFYYPAQNWQPLLQIHTKIYREVILPCVNNFTPAALPDDEEPNRKKQKTYDKDIKEHNTLFSSPATDNKASNAVSVPTNNSATPASPTAGSTKKG